jgi:hypothetical protein
LSFELRLAEGRCDDGIMKRIQFAVLALVFATAGVMIAQSPATIAVVRDPGCGCCMNWVAHLKRAGYKTTVTESTDMDGVKDAKGVPMAVRSCHTATIDGYVIEGHVPAADIQRLLKERPKGVVGLAVAGMPSGSPGMESASGRAAPYNVLAFDKAGKTTVFAAH